MNGKVSALALALVVALVVPTVGQDAGALCSTLAASPDDPSTPEGEGRLLEDIDTAAATKACQDAVSAAPADPRMHFQLGRAFDAAQHYTQALGEYGTAAELGFPLADLAIGGFYESGLGVEADAAQAVLYYQRSFNAGKLPIAAANLGYMFDNGVGVDVDKTKAAEFYEIASDAGIAWATTNLGFLYEQGTGVEADLVKAVALYKQAADAGNPDAANNLGSAYELGQGGLPQSYEKAMEFYQIAIDGGSGIAADNLANIYVYGRGVPQDNAKAREYFRKAIASNDPYAVARAQNSLAWNFVLEGINLGEAEKLASDALTYDPNDAAVIDTLGWVKHLRGDDQAALDLLSKAAEVLPATSQLAHLGSVQSALGQIAQAKASYTAALAAVPDEFDDATVDLGAIKAWLKTN